MDALLVILVSAPLVTTVLCAFVGRHVAQALTLVTGVASVVLAAFLVRPATDGVVTFGFLRADSLSLVFLLATTFLYGLCAMYAIGYLAEEAHEAAAGSAEDRAQFARYSRRFYVGINAFAWSMVCAPLVNGLALLWIAVEVTTVISALLVALDDTEGATEAAWKYVLIASAGLGIGLLATIFMYYAGAHVLGDSYDLAFDPLLAAGSKLPATPVRLAFVLAVVGYGTKVGLFPVHTWLPDAHAEAPTPVSALLSGSLLAIGFYAILRFFQITTLATGAHFAQTVLLVFGVLSLLLAALYLFDQHNIKRLLAYSSVEHMGILAIGISFGTPIALGGVLLHVLAHAAAKGSAFMGAGVLVRKFATKELHNIRNGLGVLPFSGPLFLMAIFALSAMPPFGIFRSEFQIAAGGIESGKNVITIVFVVLVTLAFLGLAAATTRVLFRPAGAEADQSPAGGTTRGEPSWWMVVPMAIGILALIVLGVAVPHGLLDLLTHGAAELQVAGS